MNRGDLQGLWTGTVYAAKKYDLGDGGVLQVELKDYAEGINGDIAVVPLATSGSTEM